MCKAGDADDETTMVTMTMVTQHTTMHILDLVTDRPMPCISTDLYRCSATYSLSVHNCVAVVEQHVCLEFTPNSK